MPWNSMSPSVETSSKSSSKCFSVRIITMDCNLEFNIESQSTGKDLFDLVCRTIGLREIWYFGLQYVDKKGYIWWLKMKKKILNQEIIKNYPTTFLFLAKYFPEKVSEELIQDVTKHLFFLQVKQSILNMDIYCPAEAAVLLASYAAQAQHGDIDEINFDPTSLSMEEYLPQRVIDQHEMSMEMWAENIKIWYADHKGMTRVDAETEYLKIVQDFDMYGINYFQIKDNKKTNLWLGIDAKSLKIFEEDNRLQPKICFNWNEIKNISVRGKKFTIKPTSKAVDCFNFFSSDPKINKLMYELCVGNHELYINRRLPDSMEVQQMKTRAREEKVQREIEKHRLAKENKRLDEVLKEKEDLERKLQEIMEETKVSHEVLMKTEEAVELFAEKAQTSEEEASLLRRKAMEAESKAQHLQQFALKLEEEKNLFEKKANQMEVAALHVYEDLGRSVQENTHLKNNLYQFQLHNPIEASAVTHPFSASESLYSGSSIYPTVLNSSLPTDDLASAIIEPTGDLYSTRQTEILPNTDIEQLSLELEKEKNDYLEKRSSLQQQLQALKSEINGMKASNNCLDQLHKEVSVEKMETQVVKPNGQSTKTKVAFLEEL